MHSVAPRTGPEEINVAEEQHEYRQLVAAPYMLTYADGLEPAFTLLTRWRCTDEDLALLLGVDVDTVRAIQQVRPREDVYLGTLTFGHPLQPINIQVGPAYPTDWRVSEEQAGYSPPAVAERSADPGAVLTPGEWAQASAALSRDLPEVHRTVIALANHALPDDDPQKITWDMVDALRPVAGDVANVLSNYLPPR